MLRNPVKPIKSKTADQANIFPTFLILDRTRNRLAGFWKAHRPRSIPRRTKRQKMGQYILALRANPELLRHKAGAVLDFPYLSGSIDARVLHLLLTRPHYAPLRQREQRRALARPLAAGHSRVARVRMSAQSRGAAPCPVAMLFPH